MAAIIRGTTPTIKYTFNTVDVSDIRAAYLNIKKGSVDVLEKDISTALSGDNYLSWTFTQEETLAPPLGEISARVNWRKADGTRGASKKIVITVEQNSQEVVI